MNFLEASLEDVSREELKQAEVRLIMGWRRVGWGGMAAAMVGVWGPPFWNMGAAILGYGSRHFGLGWGLHCGIWAP